MAVETGQAGHAPYAADPERAPGRLVPEPLEQPARDRRGRMVERAIGARLHEHGDRADAGHDLALGQMPVAHQSLAAVVGQLVGMAGEQGCYLGLDGLRQALSFYGSTRTYHDVLALHGLQYLCDKLHQLSLRGEWQKMRERNEALDCYVYARAAAAAAGLDRFDERHWCQLASQLGVAPSLSPVGPVGPANSDMNDDNATESGGTVASREVQRGRRLIRSHWMR